MFSTNVPQILVRGVTSMHAAFGLIMGLNLYNFYWMSKARKNPYYTDPLFPEAAISSNDEEA
jgi:hypothetical protein